MTTPDELLRLAERVEQGSGADTMLASAIFYALGMPKVTAYLTSLDAVEALRQRLLPGTGVNIECELGEKPFKAWITWNVDRATVQSEFGSAPTEARARLAALLRAVAAQEA